MKKKGIINSIIFYLSFSFGMAIGFGVNKPEKEVFVYSNNIQNQTFKFSDKNLLVDMPESPVVLESEKKSTEKTYSVNLKEVTVVANNITHNEKCVDSDTGDEENDFIQIEPLPIPVVLLDVEQIPNLSEKTMLI